MEQLAADTSLGRSLAAARGNQHGPCITLNSLTEAICAVHFAVEFFLFGGGRGRGPKVSQLPDGPKQVLKRNIASVI